MKKFTLLFAALLLSWQMADALTVHVTGVGEVPADGLELTVTEAEADPFTGKDVMGLTGTLECNGTLQVTITRSNTDLVDEFCCDGTCTSGNGETVQNLNFAPTAESQWFVHYTPADSTYETITYRFKDDTDSCLLTVHFAYGAEPIPTSFTRKHLIEEFTGQTCGYCPGGMDKIHAFMGDDPNWILVLHHYGYQEDSFTVPGSATIGRRLDVDGAPSIDIDRAKTNYSSGKAIVFSPYDLPATDKSQFATETYASVNIENTFDAESLQLSVHVSGLVLDNTKTNLKLTVLVKESGMIAPQADYTNGYWQKFRHTNAVRVFLTAATGKAITIDDTQHYSMDLTTTLNNTWKPENCMVVAFLSEGFNPVIQTEEEPVVAGTAGGADIHHGGVTDEQGVEETHAKAKANKVLKDGQLLIDRNGRIYTVTGTEIQ